MPIYVRKIARIEDKATATFLDEIEFSISATERRRLTLAPAVVNNRGHFKNALLNHGAILPKNKEELQRLLTAVAQSDPPEQWVYEDHVGWIRNGKAYVTLDGVIGDASAKIKGINRSNTTKDASGQRRMNGTAKGWRDRVAAPAENSSIMMLAICVALAGPLLYFLKRRSFTINIFGKTRTGKTIATLMGASMIGIRSMSDLINWNLTDSRLEQRLREYNDAIFPIDDLETMSEEKTDKEKYLRIRSNAYNLEQGWAKGRHDSYTLAHGGTHEQWCCIAVTSFEKSIRDLAQSVRLERQPGETLRLMDVPALFDGLDHIFDQLPSGFKTDDFEKWKKKTFAEIADACAQNHGVAFRTYIRYLIENRRFLKQYISKWVDDFVEGVQREEDGDIARDVAQKFGLLFVGGLLGIICGLLPWHVGTLRRAIAKCYFGARDLLPDDGVALRDGIAALKARLLKLAAYDPDVQNAEDHCERIDGYRELEPGRIRFVIKRDAFNAIFASAHERELVLEWMIQKQRITLAVSKVAPAGSKASAKYQHRWPDGERRRSYEIRWPSTN
jgi:hypothetical protein